MKIIKNIFITGCLLCLFLPQARAEEVLSWGDCLAEARKNNPDLISAAEGISEQKADKAIARSDLLPQIDASLDASTEKTITTSATTFSVIIGIIFGIWPAQKASALDPIEALRYE